LISETATDTIIAASEAPIPTDSMICDSEINLNTETNIPQTESAERVRVIWGTNIVISETISAFKSFLVNFTLAHRFGNDSEERGHQLLASDFEPLYPRLMRQLNETEVRNLNLDVKNLGFYPLTLAFKQQLTQYPQEIIPLMDMVINEYFAELFPEVDISADPIQVRPFNLDQSVNMRDLDPSDIDKMISIKGLIIRVSNIVPDMRVGFFTCTQCNSSVTSENIKGRISEPTRCPNPNCQVAHSMVLVHNRCSFSDKQIIKIQETPDAIPDGQTPHSVSLCVYDALVDVARPGDRVEVTGIFRSTPIRVNARQRRLKSLFRTYIDVVHLKRTDKDRLQTDAKDMSSEEFLVEFDETDRILQDESSKKQIYIEMASQPDIYARLTKSIAPSVWKLDDVKKGLLLQLFGGISKTLKKSGNARFRGDINILLAGDPGVSKSQLLQYVHKLAPRGIYTSGKGSSAVGLTAYITRDTDTNQLVLESGALVLSDGGICCIDEFDKMSDSTRAILHEVMEQQTISIAKAGIITTLNARASILASANPIDSKYNPKRSIIENLNLPPTLLSRFDLIYLILDMIDVESDQRLGRHIVSLYTELSPVAQTDVMDLHTLIGYISFARSLQPILTDDAVKLLSEGYVSMRKVNGSSSSGKTISATTRQLESLIRLSEAHAKMRLSETIDAQDVNEAIRLIREALLSYAIDPLTGKIDMDLITTGKSSAARERTADLKRHVKSFLSDRSAGAIDFNSMLSELNSHSSISIPEKMLRDVLEELVDEEFVHTSNGTARRGNPIIHRQIS
jgi:DNA replication licensing factor MCM4